MSSTDQPSSLTPMPMLRERRPTGNIAAPATVSAAARTAATSPNTNTNYRICFVPYLDGGRSLKFDTIRRDLKVTDAPLRIVRVKDSSAAGLAKYNALNSKKLAFNSKVVSRAHAEIWVESGGRFFIKDTRSSSGTFLNRTRLSISNTESRPHQIKDGDILQIGVPFQGGIEDIYKSVKMRIEVGREWQTSADTSNTNSDALKNVPIFHAPPTSTTKEPTMVMKLPSSSKTQNISDCPVCLFSITIGQALFIAPCSHTFHYKCIRPLLESHHPAFSCILCRAFADLDKDVEVEIEDEEAVALHRSRSRRPSTGSSHGDLFPKHITERHSYHNAPTTAASFSKSNSMHHKHQGRRSVGDPPSTQGSVSNTKMRQGPKAEAKSPSSKPLPLRVDSWNLDQRLASISARRPKSPTSSSSSYGSVHSTHSRASSWSKSPRGRIPGTSRDVLEFPFGYPTPD